ncbi:hypothetical protein Q8W71_30800 [Methylobacterium sp. NEAU 140]|uniref:hypothetical protein n=1 Tax=Methylobacterium sp. NEAU 140 TaxID=3064945 RepID=UPI002736C1E5|nr:hypothetical protein [Methylobacterium sp. NEAU 140]MDP4026982.1 hypothetical protein [Methylobacterium sp. NEAU 140]
MSEPSPAFMLDTNVFSRVVDGVIPVPAAAGRRLLVTGVQADECRATPCPARRAELLRAIEELAPELCLASTFCLGIEGAGFGQAEWNDGSGRFDAMLTRLKAIDRKPPRQHVNQIRDIVIAETALKLGATLVSDDGALRQIVLEFGGTADPSSHLT